MPDQTVPTAADPRLAELARQRRLWAIERADGRTDLFASAEPIPTTTADLRPVTTIDGHLDGLVVVATHTAGVFLVVELDDHGREVEEIAESAMWATAAGPAAVELAVAGIDLIAGHLSATVATLEGLAELAGTAGYRQAVDRALDALEVAVPRLQAAVARLLAGPELVPLPPTGPTIAGGAGQ